MKTPDLSPFFDVPPDSASGTTRDILLDRVQLHELLAGRLTQYRCPLFPQPVSYQFWGQGMARGLQTHYSVHARFALPVPPHLRELQVGCDHWLPCPFGKVGDRLVVKESVALLWTDRVRGWHYVYRTEGHPPYLANRETLRWKPATRMPREAVRRVLQIVSIRAERLHNITETDARASGTPPNWAADLSSDVTGGLTGFNPDEHGFLPPNWDALDDNRYTAREAYSLHWDRLHRRDPAHAWRANPWVWRLGLVVLCRPRPLWCSENGPEAHTSWRLAEAIR